MKNGARLFLIILSLVLAFCLVACDDGPTDTNTSTNTDTSTNTNTNNGTDTNTNTNNGADTNPDTNPDTDTDTSTDTGTGEHTHAYSDWTVIKEPTCTKPGTRVKQCGCGDYVTEEIPLAEHTPKIVAGKEATCTEEGLTNGESCSVCGKVLIEQETIPVLPHDIVDGMCKNCPYNIFSKGFEYALSTDESYYILKGMGECTDTELYIGGTYDGKPVKEIASEAFYNQKRIRTVIIGNGVEKIGSGAFYGCERLTEVVIGNDVKALSGFEYCEGIARMTIGSGVTSVDGSFSQSFKLIELYNLSSLDLSRTSVGQHALNIYTPTSGKSKTFETDDGYIFYEDGSTRYLVAYKGYEKELILPESCNGKGYEIYTYAFNDQDEITRVVIPNSVTRLQRRAISYCDLVAEIIIGDGVTTIEYDSISANEKLTFLTIGKSVTSISLGQNERLVEIYNKSSTNISSGVALNIYTPTNGTKKTFQTDDGYIFYEDGDVRYLIGYLGGEVDLVLPDSCNGKSYEIYKYAFFERSSSTGYQEEGKPRSVVIPSAVTAIGTNAFANNLTLKSVTIGENVALIESNAFGGCSKLVYVCNLSKLQIELGASTHGMVAQYAIGLDTVKNENGGIETTEDGFVFISTATNNYIIDYVGKETSLVLPNNYKGKAYEISPNAFWGKGLTSITIPQCISSIGTSAFNGCRSLTSVNYLGTVEQWCNISFGSSSANPIYYARSLYINNELVTSLVIPNTVTEIKDYAFYGCTSLTSVTIPSSVTGVGSSAFYGCTSLKYNEYNNAYYLGNDTEPYLVLIKAKNTSISSCIINESTKTICQNAFDGCRSLTSIVIPDSVTSIGERAFYNCTSLTSVTIPDSVTSIGYYAFSYCTSLTSVNYLGTVAQWCNISFGNSSANPLYNGAKLYLNGTEVTDLVIPNTVTEIKDYAFYGCTSLTSVTIPSSVTGVGSSAFYGCTSLKYNEYNNAYYLGNDTEPYLVLIKAKNTSISSCIINESTKTICQNAFDGCRSLTSIVIPDSVTSIGERAFYNCTSLTSVTIGNSVTSIGDNAFSGCTSLTSITIPDSVTSIGSSAFFNCTSLASVNYLGTVAQWCNISFDASLANPLYYAKNLYINSELVTSLVISDAVTEIKDYAFSGYTSLTSVTIGNGVTVVGSYAFYNCTSLTSVTIGDSVTSIGEAAFRNCTSLTSVTIGNGVTVVGSSAFRGCASLTSIEIPNSVTVVGGSAFYDCPIENATIPTIAISYVRNSKLKTVVINGGTSIESYAFENCTSLSSIVIPNSVTSIGSYAFDGCTSLTSITIPNSVTSIGSFAFNNCPIENATIPTIAISYVRNSKLKTVVINGGTSIGYWAFYDCTGLTSVTIGNSVTSIGDYAFRGCTSLTSILVPNSVTSMESDAFYGCTSLTIYCEAKSKPSGWSTSWNSSNRPVVWGCCTHSSTKEVPAVEPTCTKTGLTEGIACAYCGVLLSGQDTIPVNSNNHTNVQELQPPRQPV